MLSLNQGYTRFAYAFLALFALLVVVGLRYSEDRERFAQLAFQAQRAQSNVQAVEDQITQAFQLIENIALTLPELSEVPLAQAKSADLARLLNRLQLSQPAVRSLSVMSLKNQITASTNDANVGVVVPLEGFVPPDGGEAQTSVLRIGNMWQGRDFADGKALAHGAVSNKESPYFLPLSLRLGSGAEVVWVLVAVNTDYLLSCMARYTHADTDQFAMMRFDGNVLMQSSEDVSARVAWSELLPVMREREIGSFAEPHMMAYRASSRYPFFFAILINADAALAPWRTGFQIFIFWIGTALMMGLIIMWLLLRQVNQIEKEQLRQQMELERSVDRAEAAADAKSQFLATMSHEIRTPMNGVLGMTELLAATALTDEQAQLLRVLQSSGRTLLTLIDDILDFSKIEVGKLELEQIEFNLHTFLTDLKDTFTVQAQGRGLELVLLPTQGLPAMIKGDPTRLRQVFSNLIANAIKFTHQGQVTIGVRRTDVAHEFEVSIQDTGIGIDADVQKRLFRAFTQANSSITREYGGTGLGLAISVMLVQLMGGRVWMQSELGQGSTFCFTFKAESVPEMPVPTKPKAEPAAEDMGHLRVLLVEDHQINRLLMTKILNRVNIEPDVACDGLEALERVKEKNYDVILMDLQMPNMDGLAATQRIREQQLQTQPYIIALTANAFAEDRANSYAAGMNDFISKPVSIEGLVSALKRARGGK